MSPAVAIAATAANTTTAAAMSSVLEGDLTIANPFQFPPGTDDPLLWICSSETRQEVAQIERVNAINGYRRAGMHYRNDPLPPQPRDLFEEMIGGAASFHLIRKG